MEFLYCGTGTGYSTSSDPSDIMGFIYDIYQIPTAQRLGVLSGTRADESIAGMDTFYGRIMMPTSSSIWNVYACINNKSELFYFILQDDTEKTNEIFTDMLYETEKSSAVSK